jgi:hypothetical protein
LVPELDGPVYIGIFSDIIFLFFPSLSRVLKWGLLFDERRGLTTNDHLSSTGA